MSAGDFFWERGNGRVSTLAQMRFWQRSIFGRYVSIAIHPKAEKIQGITSHAGRWRHAILWDYDLPPELIIQNLSWIQSRYNLTDLYILRTQHGCHVYCLKTVTKRELFRILVNSPGIDWAFVTWTIRVGNSRLRIEGGDLEPWGVLHSPLRKNVPGSSKHRELLETFGFEILEDLNWDESEFHPITLHKPRKVTV